MRVLGYFVVRVFRRGVVGMFLRRRFVSVFPRFVNVLGRRVGVYVDRERMRVLRRGVAVRVGW